MVRFVFSLVVTLVFLGNCVQLSGQTPVAVNPEEFWDNGIGHSTWSVALEPDDRKKMLSLWDSIGEDLQTERNDLAGTYVKGGNDGFFLRWSVAKGYVIVPYFDQNLITDYGYGNAKVVDAAEVEFIPAKDLRGGRGLGKMPRQWTAILGRFMPVETLADFCEYRAGLGEYNEFNGSCCEFSPDFLVGRVDRLDKSLPAGVPARYEHFLKKPASGTIVHVGKTRRVRNWGYEGQLYSQWIEKAALTPVSIDVGSRQGVKKNMLFRMKGEPEFGRYLQVTAVGSQSSKGYVVQDISVGSKEGFYRDYQTDQNKPLPRIRAGIQITTSPVVQ